MFFHRSDFSFIIEVKYFFTHGNQQRWRILMIIEIDNIDVTFLTVSIIRDTSLRYSGRNAAIGQLMETEP